MATTNVHGLIELPPTSDKSRKQTTMKQLRSHISIRDDVNSYSSEASNTPLLELQKLPGEEKVLIGNFVQEKISSLHCKDEDVPVKLQLLAEAARETDDDQNEALEAIVEGKTRLPGSLLHIAAAIGLYWIVEMQIKAGVDLTALDTHSWTALMVATAQGHRFCTQLLSEHMLNLGENSSPDAIPPSGLVETQSSTIFEFGQGRLTATPGSWHFNLQRRVQVRSNHPIPPKSASFYYEITILRNGPLKYVYCKSKLVPIAY